jgi:integrase
LRVGGGERLEVTMPKALGERRAEQREKRLKELAALLRPLPVHAESKRLMRLLAVASDPELADKYEKVIRRFVREPKKAAPESTGAKLVTFREFGLHWATGGLHAEFPRYWKKPHEDSTIKTNVARVRKLSEFIGDIPIVQLTYEQVKSALGELPDEDTGTTYRHFCQVIQTILRRAIEPAGILAPTAYPLPWMKFLPPTSTPPAHGILYPADDLRLLRGKHAPLWRRVLYGFAMREGMRLSHIFRLRYSNIDFDNGMITIGIGKNNADARTWELNAGVANALDHFRGKAKIDSFIFPRLTRSEMLDLAKMLRDDLYTAGVTREVRPDLFAADDGIEPVRFQDLRATFVSLHLAMGWPYHEIMQRTQHTSSKVIEKHYARRIDIAKRILAKQGPLAPLDAALGWAPLPRPPKPRNPLPARKRVGGEVGGEN